MKLIRPKKHGRLWTWPVFLMNLYKGAEPSASVGRALVWGSKGCWVEPHHLRGHCVVSLGEIHALLLSTCSAQ